MQKHPPTGLLWRAGSDNFDFVILGRDRIITTFLLVFRPSPLLHGLPTTVPQLTRLSDHRFCCIHCPGRYCNSNNSQQQYLAVG